MTRAMAMPTLGKSWSTMQVTNSETRLPMQEVYQVGQTIAFCRLLGWAFGPRNFMKNAGRRGAGTRACRAGTRAGAWRLASAIYSQRVFRPSEGRPTDLPR